MKMKIFTFLLLTMMCKCFIAHSQTDSANTTSQTDSIPVASDSLLRVKTNSSISNTLQQFNSLDQDKQQLRAQYEKDSMEYAKKRNDLRSAANQDQNLINTLDVIIKSKQTDYENALKKISSDSITAINNLNATIKSLNDTVTNRQKVINTLNDTVINKQKALVALQAQTGDVASNIEKLKASRALLDDSAEIIGTLQMSKRPVVVRTDNAKRDSIFSIVINHIHVTVKEGNATEIIVNTDTGIFRNKHFIPDILHFDKYRSAHLEYVSQEYHREGDKWFIFLDDALKYIPKRSFADMPYADFDIDLVKDTTTTHDLRESTSLNAYFNVAGFTDIKGISGEANGIAQFTGEAKFITQTQPIVRKFNAPTSEHPRDITQTSSWVLFNYVSFKGGLAKFDNSFKGTFLKKIPNQQDSVGRKDLLQRANYYVGAKANIFKIILPPTPYFFYSYIELNTGYNFVGSRVFDTIQHQPSDFIDTVFRSVTQNQFYIEPIVSFSRHRNLSMSLTLPLFFNSVKQSAGISNYKTEYWAMPGISLMYYGKKDSGSKLFFRYNHYINLRDKTQAFSQLQLGLSLNLTDVWKTTSQQ